MKKILVLQGPNLNMLKIRETEIYGTLSLETIHEEMARRAEHKGFLVTCIQSNHEGILVDAIQQALSDEIAYIILNPAAYTHTSIAMRDALLAVAIPFIEVHISNIYKREDWRKHSWFSDIAEGVICGFGASGYYLALETAMTALEPNTY